MASIFARAGIISGATPTDCSASAHTGPTAATSTSPFKASASGLTSPSLVCNAKEMPALDAVREGDGVHLAPNQFAHEALQRIEIVRHHPLVKTQLFHPRTPIRQRVCQEVPDDTAGLAIAHQDNRLVVEIDRRQRVEELFGGVRLGRRHVDRHVVLSERSHGLGASTGDDSGAKCESGFIEPSEARCLLEQKSRAAAGQEKDRVHLAGRQTVDERPDAIRMSGFACRWHAVRHAAESPDMGGRFIGLVSLEQCDAKAVKRRGQWLKAPKPAAAPEGIFRASSVQSVDALSMVLTG